MVEPSSLVVAQFSCRAGLQYTTQSKNRAKLKLKSKHEELKEFDRQRLQKTSIVSHSFRVPSAIFAPLPLHQSV